MPHHDIPVYQIAALRTPVSDPARAGVWQGVALLAGLAARASAARTSAGRFATLVRDLLQSEGGFASIDRVCLARQISGSNQLEIVDVFTSAGLPASKMVVGYRCVVDPDGSLMHLEPGQVRCYQDAREVVASYARQARPVQRSIGLIQNLGLRSGLCLPVWLAGRRLGFLFVNSVVPGAYDSLSDVQCGLLTLAVQAATVELAAGTDHLPAGGIASTLTTAELASALAHHLTSSVINPIDVHGQGEVRCLVVVEHLALVATAALAACWQPAVHTLSLTASIADDRLLITCQASGLAPTPLVAWHLLQAQRLALQVGMRLECTESRIAISLPVDVATPGITYST